MAQTVLIENGKVVDGTGSPAFRSDVFIRNGHIEEIGILPHVKPTRRVDASGLWVAPGFIDAHTHLDFLLPSPHHSEILERWVRQGVTTLVAGNCGYSPAPISPAIGKEVSLYWNFALPRNGMNYEWTSMGEYLDTHERNGQALNVAILTGHNVLRAGVMGFQARFASTDELHAMKRMLSDSLEEGAIGVSLGLFFFPGLY
jgi:N-acyl-D-aspartate/D-glutamate deacylase